MNRDFAQIRLKLLQERRRPCQTLFDILKHRDWMCPYKSYDKLTPYNIKKITYLNFQDSSRFDGSLFCRSCRTNVRMTSIRSSPIIFESSIGTSLSKILSTDPLPILIMVTTLCCSHAPRYLMANKYIGNRDRVTHFNPGSFTNTKWVEKLGVRHFPSMWPLHNVGIILWIF